MSKLVSISPQFLVSDLEASIRYFCEKLGFVINIRYENFYASVRRDAVEIHLKCAEQCDGERQHRKQNEHLDAYIAVDDAVAVYESLIELGANIYREIETRPWGVKDFYVEDLDGHIICFGQLGS